MKVLVKGYVWGECHTCKLKGSIIDAILINRGAEFRLKLCKKCLEETIRLNTQNKDVGT